MKQLTLKDIEQNSKLNDMFDGFVQKIYREIFVRTEDSELPKLFDKFEADFKKVVKSDDKLKNKEVNLLDITFVRNNKVSSIFFEAIKYKKFGFAKFLIAKNPEVLSSKDFFKTAIKVNAPVEILNYIYQNRRPDFNEIYLYQAFSYLTKDNLEKFLSQNNITVPALVNNVKPDASGKNLLHYALSNRDETVLEYCLANMPTSMAKNLSSKPDRFERTPLDYVSNKELFRVFAQHGVEPNGKWNLFKKEINFKAQLEVDKSVITGVVIGTHSPLLLILALTLISKATASAILVPISGAPLVFAIGVTVLGALAIGASIGYGVGLVLKNRSLAQGEVECANYVKELDQLKSNAKDIPDLAPEQPLQNASSQQYSNLQQPQQTHQLNLPQIQEFGAKSQETQIGGSF